MVPAMAKWGWMGFRGFRVVFSMHVYLFFFFDSKRKSRASRLRWWPFPPPFYFLNGRAWHLRGSSFSFSFSYFLFISFTVRIDISSPLTSPKKHIHIIAF